MLLFGELQEEFSIRYRGGDMRVGELGSTARSRFGEGTARRNSPTARCVQVTVSFFRCCTPNDSEVVSTTPTHQALYSQSAERINPKHKLGLDTHAQQTTGDMWMQFSKLFYAICVCSAFACMACSCSSDTQVVEPQDPNPPDTSMVDQNVSRTYRTEHHTVGGIFLEIYIPSDYDETRKYPTLYFNDGDLFADVFGSLTGLEAEPFLMVGLSDGNNRAARFAPYDDNELTAVYGNYTPGAAAYTSAIVEEVIPFVEARYKSNNRALFGISLGGLHATWAGIKYPGTFSFIGALSPSFWVGGGALFFENLESLRPMGLGTTNVFYLDRGTLEWRNLLPFVAGLKDVDLVYGHNIFYYEDIGADHDISAWRIRVENPFRLFMEGAAEIASIEVNDYCAVNLDNPGGKQGRINPIVTTSNGITYSVMSETEFEVLEGNGIVQLNGDYFVHIGSSLTVECRYKGIVEEIEVVRCN